MNLQEIVNFGECGYIEYKSEWYWDLNTNSPKDTDWGEFIKDVLALINANSSSIEKTRYLVIGYDESNNDYYNFNLTDENYPNLSKKMKDKLRNFISEFSKIKFKLELKKTNKGNIILISIEQPIMLHALSKNIKTRTIEYPKNTVLGRVHNEGNYGKYDSVGILSEEEKEEIKSKLQQPLNNFSTKRRKKSIQATINSYLEVNNSFKLNNDTSKNSDELDKYYEFYELIGTSEQYFLYISDISIKATIDKFKKDIFSKLDNKLIELIVLTDAPKETTKNRRKENLEKYLKESKINHFKIHFIDDFGKDFLYRDHIEPFLFDKDYQNTKYFIDSHVTSKERPSEELKASEVISSWFQEEDNPVIVLTGEGGIGKTTLAKYFLNNTLKNLTDDKQYVLFLDSATLVGKLKESRIHSIYDLYKVDTDEKKSPSFTDSLFKLSIDNGSFIIVLDGLDEIISKLGDDFQLISFLERIYQDYCFNLSKTKIIITCRDSVWEEAVSGKKIAHLPPKSIYSMKAFNFEQVEEFFRTCFKNEQDSDKLEKKAKSFVEKLITTTGNKSNENIYSPFILDRIREIILDNISEQQLEDLFDDSYNLDSLCFSKSNRNDYFIYSVCKREIIKTQITVEDQIKLLCSLCKYNDLLSHYEFCNELKNILNRKATKQDEHSFISHPFIYSNDSRTKIGLKYDFLKDFFLKF
ncbi:NACHT domain-containing protein [Pelistega sp. NLN82]|uniref:NACHT domain-containing protein n=1 Tax=Pelistega ratti TaxID=2652177 RepID=A0A6L9YA28_9BURK|nr:NACHT domain-containing protein [Pelistega ratti]NEN76574.1 NACHT domain-containing protein [Pelistega ratti]